MDSEYTKKRNNKLYNKSGKMRNDAFEWNYHDYNKKNEKSDDTIVRNAVLKEVEKRVKNGEELSTVTLDIASREEIKKHFSYFEKNGITKPINEFFADWYLNKVKHKAIVDKIHNLDDRIIK